MQLKSITAAYGNAIFVIFRPKEDPYNAIQTFFGQKKTFLTLFKPHFTRFGSHLKGLNFPAPPPLTNRSSSKQV